jgi:ElaB/YqjD/DUF883 family membrane-anchored ribosome-binding protein
MPAVKGVAQGLPLRANIRLLAEACGEALLNPRNLVANGAKLRDQAKGAMAMSSSIEDAIHGAEDATTQIARLRAQVESLMRDLVTPAVADVAGRAEIALRTASDKVREQAETVSGKVREQPLLAVLIAAAVGFVLGRVTR